MPGRPSALPVDKVDYRVRDSVVWSEAHGYDGGFPTFHEVAQDGRKVAYGTLCFKELAGCERVDIPKREIQDRFLSDIPQIFRLVGDWARGKNYRWGMPTFFSQGAGDSVAYNAMAWKGGQHHDVPRSELDNVALNDVPAMFRAVNTWAYERGWRGAVPTFHEADYGNGVVYGVETFSKAEMYFQDVKGDVLSLHRRFSFDGGISEPDRLRLIRGHSTAFHSIEACGNLSESERSKVLRAYGRKVEHRFETDDGVFARAKVSNRWIDAIPVVGDDWISINFEVLFGRDDQQVARTLLHEMMHVAGYSHPKLRRGTDKQGDGGPYDSSPPVRASKCVAEGSILEDGTDALICTVAGGVATVE